MIECFEMCASRLMIKDIVSEICVDGQVIEDIVF